MQRMPQRERGTGRGNRGSGNAEQSRGAPRSRQTARRSRGGHFAAAQRNDSQEDIPELIMTGSVLVDGDSDEGVNGDIPRGLPGMSSYEEERDQARSRLPPLQPASGPPIKLKALIGGALAVIPNEDPRLTAVSMGFPISVHPLRTPNARAQVSTASRVSVIDYRFVRLAGLLHTLVPIREGIDDVQLETLTGTLFNTFGRVPVHFDACGFEFTQDCWVVNLGLPVDMQLGCEWLAKYDVELDFAQGMSITDANAKKVRNLQDVYVTV